MAEHPDAASRVIQGVIQGLMAGISFIGAGVIIRDVAAQSVQGLTTAATVWMTAALGIVCGLAMWRTAVVSIALALVLLIVVSWIERWMKLTD
jgi:putative Mg2+ transporter-C (MgtC) family protein